jgi:Putative DNA-binding domain
MVRHDTNPCQSRLTESLAADHGKLQAYLGASAFSAIGRLYSAKYPQLEPSVRWFSRNLPKFLGETLPYSRSPELAELARLEGALNAAFEAPEVSVLTSHDLVPYEIHGLDGCGLQLHPSVQLLCFTLNTTSLWAALQCGELPPRPEHLAVPQRLVVWRQGSQPRFRMLGQEEALALGLALEATPFSGIVEALVEVGNGTPASGTAETYLRGWVSAELVSAIRILKASGEK